MVIVLEIDGEHYRLTQNAIRAICCVGYESRIRMCQQPTPDRLRPPYS
jgi:hypothetical protein